MPNEDDGMSDAIKPHLYSPDYQAQGDCRVCGHGPEASWHKDLEERLRIQAMGAALSRRDWSATERAYNVIRDHYDQQTRIDGQLARQLSRAMGRNARYANAIKATIDDLERRMTAENSSIIDRLKAVLK
jgi:hypothetical protein